MQRRIIAHYMHEYEEGPAKNIVKPIVATDSFLMADADEQQIEDLRKAGVIVTFPDEEEHDPADTRPMARARRADVSFAAPIAATEPDYYIIELVGPLFPAWRTELAAEGVELVEGLSPSQYTARLTPNQVGAAQQKSFVRGIARYGEDQTMPAPIALQPLAFGGVSAPYEVRLQRSEDKAAVIEWLDARGISVEMEHARRLRIGVQPNNAQDLADLAKVKGVKTVQEYVPRYDVRLHRPEERRAVAHWFKSNAIEVVATSQRKFRVVIEDKTLLNQLRKLPQVARVDEYVPPDIANDIARSLLGIDRQGGPSLSLTGKDQIVGVADTGIDDQHRDFTGRILDKIALGRKNDTSDPDGHGTHVAGSIVGTGQESGGKIRGMAPEAKVVFQSLLDADGELGGLPLELGSLLDEAYKKGARIHNNSWGAAMGGRYTVNSYEIDDFVDSHRDMLVVVAAGNEGSAAQPKNAKQGFVEWSSVGSPASCKNALTVGAARSNRTSGGYSGLTYKKAWPRDFPDAPIANEKISGDPNAIAGFSSRGPCDDYRIKPDVVAPGTDIVSTRSHLAPPDHFWGIDPANSKYAFDGGTSMAAPIVSGCAALVREYYEKKRNHHPSAALLKATLINGAKRLTGTDANADHNFVPNYHQGFGAIDMTRTVPDPAVPPFSLEFLDEADASLGDTGDRIRKKFAAKAGWLRLTMAWTDPEGRSVQNSLTMILEHVPTRTKYLGNAQVPLGFKTPDPTNNVVIIKLDQAPAGEYVIQFEAYNLLKPPQDFAFVLIGDLQSPLRPY